MKMIRKTVALLLAAALLLALGVSALAASVTIKPKDNQSHTYEAYQVYRGTIDQKNRLGSIEWGTGVKPDALVHGLITHFKGREEIAACVKEATADQLKEISTRYSTDGYPFVATANTTIGQIFTALDAKNKGNGWDGNHLITDPAPLEQAFFDCFGKQEDDTAAGKILAELLDNETYLNEGNKKEVSGTGSVTLSGLDSGYYLIKETTDLSGQEGAATRLMLKIVGSDLTVEAKSSIPAVEKKVKEANRNDNPLSSIGQVTPSGGTATGVAVGAGYGDDADYAIGDTVSFELLGTTPDNYNDYKAYYYEFTDTLSKGLTFDPSSVKVSYTNEKTTDGVVNWRVIPSDEKHYTVTSTPVTEGATALSIKFDVVYTTSETTKEVTYSDNGLKDVDGIQPNAVIKVEYTATLNENAVIGDPGNSNKVKLTFSNDPNHGGEGKKGTTPEDEVLVFTYELDSTKYKNSVGDNNKLAGAKFVLARRESDTTLQYYKDGTDGTHAWVTVNLAGKNTPAEKLAAFAGDNVKVFTSASNGVITQVKGLDKGTYLLVEVEPPAGYNIASDTTVVITTGMQKKNPTFVYTVNGTTTTGSADGTMKVNIVDQEGSVLPTTGGEGTRLLMIAGGILLVLGAVILVARRRLRAA